MKKLLFDLSLVAGAYGWIFLIYNRSEILFRVKRMLKKL